MNFIFKINYFRRETKLNEENVSKQVEHWHKLLLKARTMII